MEATCLCVVAPEDVYVVVYPLQSGKLVLEAEVGGACLLGLRAGWKAQDADPIVEAGIDDWCTLRLIELMFAMYGK